tara:strand:- start:4615 stop:4743 length:129 start_codon:yes stop_codon:yes gene_type:complete
MTLLCGERLLEAALVEREFIDTKKPMLGIGFLIMQRDLSWLN